LALLASDLRDMPPHLLAKAIEKHVLESPYLPKASDLVKLAKGFIAERAPAGPEGETLTQRRNRLLLADPHGRRDVKWVETADGGSRLVSIHTAVEPRA
jgi:hypothetical protein